MSRFVVVLGPDGAGKSTLLRQLAHARPDWAFAQPDPMALYDLRELPRHGQVHPREVIWDLPARCRTTVLAHILAILAEFRVIPALAAGMTLVCDSYDYRYRAKERVLDPDTADIIEALSAGLPRPDLAIWLDVPLDVAWSRNGNRCSRFEGGPSADRPGFLRVQKEVEKIILDEYLRDVPTSRVDGLLPRAELAQHCLEQIERHTRQQVPA